MPHDADSAIGAPEFLDHSPGNHDGVVHDIALTYREHAVARQESVGVDAHPARYRRFQWIALLAEWSMVVACCIHIEAPVHLVVDMSFFGYYCIVVVRGYFIRSSYISVPGKERSFAPCIGFVQLTTPVRKSKARTLLLYIKVISSFVI